jgi:hypothetical protein
MVFPPSLLTRNINFPIIAYEEKCANPSLPKQEINIPLQQSTATKTFFAADRDIVKFYLRGLYVKITTQ